MVRVHCMASRLIIIYMCLQSIEPKNHSLLVLLTVSASDIRLKSRNNKNERNNKRIKFFRINMQDFPLG